MTTMREAALAILRLVNEGMSLKHATQLVAATYQYTPDELYRKIAQLEKGTEQ